jgi:hypothetical protein
MNRMQHISASTLCAVGGLVFLCSCSAFESSRKMDMAPFSQNAVTLFAEAAKVSVPFQFVELKKYQNLPERQALEANAAPLIAALKGLVMYSNQLVALNNAQFADPEKNRHLAEYIEQARQRAIERGSLEELGIDDSMLDTVLVNIRSAPTYMEAIDAAAPIVDAIVYAMSEKLEEISVQVPVMMAGIDRAIEADQADQKRNLLELRALQARYHYAVTLLYRAKMGDLLALDSLRTVDPSLREYLNGKSGISAKNLQEAEDALTQRLSRLYEFMTQLLFEAQIYKAKQQELQEWRAEVDTKIRIARDALMVWAQSHHNLGKGIPVPPLIDVGGMAGGLAKKVLPLP